MSELMGLVDRLTVETHRVVHLSGGPVIAVVPPLLVELQEEIRPSGEGGGAAGGSTGSGAPVALDLVVLLGKIETDAAHLMWLARSAARAQREGMVLPGRGLCERVRWTAARLEGTVDEVEMVQVLRGWVRQIEGVFDPPKVVPLWDKACPPCGSSRTPRWDEGQEDWVSTSALTVTMGRTTVARCGECGAEWRGAEIMGLAEALGLPPAVLHLLAA